MWQDWWNDVREMASEMAAPARQVIDDTVYKAAKIAVRMSNIV